MGRAKTWLDPDDATEVNEWFERMRTGRTANDREGRHQDELDDERDFEYHTARLFEELIRREHRHPLFWAEVSRRTCDRIREMCRRLGRGRDGISLQDASEDAILEGEGDEWTASGDNSCSSTSGRSAREPRT